MTRRTLLGAAIVVVVVAAIGAGMLHARSVVAPAPPQEIKPQPIVPSAAPKTAPVAHVPAPKPFRPEDLPAPPVWTGTASRSLPIGLQAELDEIAPLGDGPANAAIWFRDFAKADGARQSEVPVKANQNDVYAFDHPLVREAAPWADQARMRFYPDIWSMRGLRTEVPNLPFMRDLARTWIARGESLRASDPGAAREDFRRAIRLGRLLMQDDLVWVQQMTGVSCIRMGAAALYEQARRERNLAEMLLCARILAEVDGYKAGMDSRFVFYGEVGRDFRVAVASGSWENDPALLHTIDDIAAEPTRCLLLTGAQSTLWLMASGSGPVAVKARTALGTFSQGKDPLIAANARWLLEHHLDR